MTFDDHLVSGEVLDPLSGLPNEGVRLVLDEMPYLSPLPDRVRAQLRAEGQRMVWWQARAQMAARHTDGLQEQEHERDGRVCGHDIASGPALGVGRVLGTVPTTRVHIGKPSQAIAYSLADPAAPGGEYAGLVSAWGGVR